MGGSAFDAVAHTGLCANTEEMRSPGNYCSDRDPTEAQPRESAAVAVAPSSAPLLRPGSDRGTASGIRGRGGCPFFRALRIARDAAGQSLFVRCRTMRLRSLQRPKEAQHRAMRTAFTCHLVLHGRKRETSAARLNTSTFRAVRPFEQFATIGLVRRRTTLQFIHSFID